LNLGALQQVIIYTDGGCEGNPGPGAWAAILWHGEVERAVSGSSPITTNNRMELQAAISALRQLNRPCSVILHTDSQYLRKGITEWLPSWKKRNWLTSTREPVKNADLWRELDGLTQGHRIDWTWVKGHAGNPNNERCDQLASAEIKKLKKAYSPAQLKALAHEFRQNP